MLQSMGSQRVGYDWQLKKKNDNNILVITLKTKSMKEVIDKMDSEF